MKSRTGTFTALIILLLFALFTPTPTAFAADRFTDDNDSIFEQDIEAIANAGITAGCNPPDNTNYCPNETVTRGEMAAFLNRTLQFADRPVLIVASGDIGASATTASVFAAIDQTNPDVMLALGDLSYDQIQPESAWCSWVSDQTGDAFPIQLSVGNHEDDRQIDGDFHAFADCMPDQMESIGSYPEQYYFDLGVTARVIIVADGLTLDGREYTFKEGSEEASWLVHAVRSARQQGISWVIVGTHKPCISIGTKPCEPGPELTNLLIAEDVDLMLSGHDHNYQRTWQLSCISVGDFFPECIYDETDTPTAGNGLVMVISGATGGRANYPVYDFDPEFGYFASFMGLNSLDNGAGYLELSLTQTLIDARFVGVTTDFTDSFQLSK